MIVLRGGIAYRIDKKALTELDALDIILEMSNSISCSFENSIRVIYFNTLIRKIKTAEINRDRVTEDLYFRLRKIINLVPYSNIKQQLYVIIAELSILLYVLKIDRKWLWSRLTL